MVLCKRYAPAVYDIGLSVWAIWASDSVAFVGEATADEYVAYFITTTRITKSRISVADYSALYKMVSRAMEYNRFGSQPAFFN